MKRQAGFSLLESIVALTILAGATMALFGWINSSLLQLAKADVYSQATPSLNSAIEYLKIQDLAARPTGTFRSQQIEIQWQAQPIEQDISGSEGSNFLLSLYEVRLLVSLKETGRTLPALYTRVVNYQLKPGIPEFENAF